ncbi:MAG TPA: hypothetical protein VFE47_20305 [Tepidisphaeraceae bacterium]|nr:hypothetical protein [Tepidisphaeraceae bacterium]
MPASPNGLTDFHKPNWSTLGAEIVCPLCGYNLRGLIDPRCPECGHSFQWPDLLDPSRRKHPYLFETHPRRNFTSFWKTAFHGLRPLKFWTTLRADQPCNRRRLVIYWLIVAMVLVITLASGIGAFVLDDNARMWGTPMAVGGWITVGGPFSPGTAPLPPPSYPIYPVQFHWPSGFNPSPLLVPLAILLAWPWLTVASLRLLRVSMRRAKIDNLHIVRCAIYSWDIVLWPALISIGICVVQATLIYIHYLSTSPITPYAAPQWMGMFPFAAWALVPPVFVYRMIVAYWRYMRFPHAVWVILLTQFIVFLLVVCVLAYAGWAAAI